MIKEYEKYKNSDIEWFDKIPEHWNCYKLKYLGYLYSGLTGKRGDDFYDEESPLSRRYINFKNIANNSKININEFDLVIINKGEEQNLVQKGDLFFLMSSENFDDIAKTAILDEEMEETYLNSFCRGFRINKVDVSPQFVNYALSGNIYRQALSNQAKGFTRINIQVGKIENFSIYLPSYDEQITITSFLDHQTALIDEIITRKEKQIELLKEKRQAIINETVTKGLNSDAKMKDSGIEWLGDIPKDWEILKFRYMIDVLTDFTANGSFADLAKNVTYLESGFSRLIRLTDLREDLKNDGIYISEESHNYLSKSTLFGKEILMANVGAYAGLAWKVPTLIGPSTLGPNMFLLKFNNRLDNDFAYFSLISNYLSIQLKNKAVSSAQPKLNKEDVRSCTFVLPPVKDQKEITNKLLEFDCKFESVLTKVKFQIEKLKEFRHSIISEAVTGKIDLRDWQPNNS